MAEICGHWWDDPISADVHTCKLYGEHDTHECDCGQMKFTKPPGPRTWSLPAEPGPEVTAVRDRYGRIWTREPDGWIYRDRPAFVYRLPWHGLFMQGHGPLTDATQEEP